MSPTRFLRHELPRLEETESRYSKTLAGISPALMRVLLLAFLHSSLAFSVFGACTAPKNLIGKENCLPGSPQSEWNVSGAGSPNIQGFAADISVNAGQTISFKILTNAVFYHIDIYRMG